MADLESLIAEQLKSRILKGILEEISKWGPDESDEEEEEPLETLYVDMEKQKRKNKRRRRKDKKKAKRRRADCSSLMVDDDLVVVEILSRLPVKSLARFKCVCKRWKSVIEHDSHFINLHHGRSEARPGFFIFAPRSIPSSMPRDDDCFLSANLRPDGSGANVCTIRKMESFSYQKILGPIGGLICLVDTFAVRIYNVSTGEVTPWIKSTVFTGIEKENDIPQCYLGFDPITGRHKVIFLWYEGKVKDLPVCEVLTVGDNSWRIIDNVPPCKPEGNISAYADGSIYWFMSNGFPPWRDCGDWCQLEYSESLMAFDIGSEKFRVILIPKFTILENAEPPCYGFLEMDGCLTVIRRRFHTVKMWKFHDYNKEYGTASTISSEKDWTEVNIRLPFLYKISYVC